METRTIPMDTRSLFKPLDDELIKLLKSLNPEDWNKQTVAKAWKVKDVVSHLLDGNLRTLSIQRDKYFGETPPAINGYEDMVKWLNDLNADWVKATRRLSPGILVLLLESTGDMVSEYYASLDPWDEAIFAVDWAGESVSYNWMHVAREYTEKWHHQQQIRDATNRQAILTKTYFYPVIDTFFQALPHTFKDVEAPIGTVIKATVDTEAGGSWFLSKSSAQWELVKAPEISPTASVTIPVDISWKLFSKSLRPEQVMKQIQIEGDRKLAESVLEMVAVMA
ncbi:MAG: maleylpyruvate isomerase N-terminal domain-containing protein [Bacteroidota bacterium]